MLHDDWIRRSRGRDRKSVTETFSAKRRKAPPDHQGVVTMKEFSLRIWGWQERNSWSSFPFLKVLPRYDPQLPERLSPRPSVKYEAWWNLTKFSKGCASLRFSVLKVLKLIMKGFNANTWWCIAQRDVKFITVILTILKPSLMILFRPVMPHLIPRNVSRTVSVLFNL